MLGPGHSAEEFRRRAGLWSRGRKSCARVPRDWLVIYLSDFHLNFVGALRMFIERGRGPIGGKELWRRELQR